MRIQVSDSGRCTSLRDYFLRLGAVAVVADGSSVDVHFPNDPINQGETIEAYLRSWMEMNHVAASVASDAPQPQTRLGDLLVAKGFITREQLAYAVVEAREQGELLGRLLLRHEWIFESELARTLAEQWGLPYLNLASIGVNRELMRLLPHEVGARAAAVPVRRVDGATQVAFADPTDSTALAAVREFFPEFVPAVAELSDIENAWRSLAPPAPLPTSDQPVEETPQPEPKASGRPKIGELFLEKGLLTRADLEDALEEQKTSGKPLGEILVNRRLIDRMHLASALSKQWAAARTVEPTQNGSFSGNGTPMPTPEPQRAEPEDAPPTAEPEEVQPTAEPEDVQPTAETEEVVELVQAIAALAGNVERLRAEVAELSTRSLNGGPLPFSATTL